MSRFYARPDARIKPTRRTPKAPTRFGAGILASRPSAGRKPYTERDLIEAAEMFAEMEGRETERLEQAELEARAIEVEWEDHCMWTASASESRCGLCGLLTPDDEMDAKYGLCPSCMDAAETASIKSANWAAGLGYDEF